MNIVVVKTEKTVIKFYTKILPFYMLFGYKLASISLKLLRQLPKHACSLSAMFGYELTHFKTRAHEECISLTKHVIISKWKNSVSFVVCFQTVLQSF